MKKVIYGILILIGIAAIASNFIIDTSKLDHKKVSASGTACKWISDTGYGTGPVYYDDTVEVKDYLLSNEWELYYLSICTDLKSPECTLNDYYYGPVYSASAKFFNGLKLLECSPTVNTGKTYSANKIYADKYGNNMATSKTITGNLASYHKNYHEDDDNYTECQDAVTISETGEVTIVYPYDVYFSMSSASNGDNITCSATTVTITNPELFNNSVTSPVEIWIRKNWHPSTGTNSTNTFYQETIDNDSISPSPTQYTCVCAEY